MKKRMKMRRVFCLLIVLLMAVSVMMPAGVMAEYALEINMDTDHSQNKTVLTDLRITELAAPQPGAPFPTQATVVSAEGVSWQVAVLWMDEKDLPVSGLAGGGSYRPVIVFFVPSEYTVRRSEGNSGSFILRIDDAVLALFGTDRLFSVFDADRGITYILSGKTSVTVAQQEESKVPSRSVSGMPEKYQAPEDSYRNPNRKDWADIENRAETAEEPAPTENTPADTGETEEPAPAEDKIPSAEDSGQKAALQSKADETPPAPVESERVPDAFENRIPEIVSIHCSKKAKDSMVLEELADFVDLIKYRLQPQAIELLQNRFPAYQEAAKNNQLGEQIGLYVYFDEEEDDGVLGHNTASDDTIAYVSAGNLENKKGDLEFQYILGVNARFFVQMDDLEDPILDANGKARLTKDEKMLANLENTIVHEMMHLFMFDYNRIGMTGIADTKLLSNENNGDGTKTQNTLEAVTEHMAMTKFPTWFMEGLATSVENNYQFRYESFNLLSYAGEGQISDWYSPDILRNAYTTSVFRVDKNKPEHVTFFDLEAGDRKGMNPNQVVDANYVSGYLACLYLGELAANKAGETSMNMGEDGSYAFESDVIREGINTVLRRLHEGETLDAVICSISDGMFADTKDFEQKFIKGDEDSTEFCAGYLNFMRRLSQDENRQFLPNGSILYPFDCDYATPLDRTKNGDSALFRIVDSSDFVPSTADLQDVADGGRSISYNEYQTSLRVVEEERAQVAAWQAVINEIVDALNVDGDIDPDVYTYIVDAVVGAQIVDAETKDSIILTAMEMSKGSEDDVMEDWDEDPDQDDLSGWDEEPDEQDSGSFDKAFGDDDESANEVWTEAFDDGAFADYPDSGDWDFSSGDGLGDSYDDSGWDDASGWD